MNTPNADGLGTQLRRLIELLDGELERIYQEDGYRYRPRYTPVMKALVEVPQLTIKDIATFSSISHSAASQTASKMLSEGFIESCPAEDGRERKIRLSAKGRKMLPKLKARWAATRKAAEKLDRELSFPLSQLLSEAIDALEKKSFGVRISEREKTRKRSSA